MSLTYIPGSLIKKFAEDLTAYGEKFKKRNMTQLERRAYEARAFNPRERVSETVKRVANEDKELLRKLAE